MWEFYSIVTYTGRLPKPGRRVCDVREATENGTSVKGPSESGFPMSSWSIAVDGDAKRSADLVHAFLRDLG